MTELVLKVSISLDGFTTPADEDPSWVGAGGSDDSMAWLVESLSGAGAHLMGGPSYTAMAGFYPTSTLPFARPMNEIPKIVFSRTLTETPWGETTIVAGDLAETVTGLKEEHTGDGYLLASAGSRFLQALAATGLVDRYQLVVHPVILGGGIPLFERRVDYTPVSTKVFSGGIVVHEFTPNA